MPFIDNSYHTGVFSCIKRNTINNTREISEQLPAQVKSGEGVMSECYLSPYISVSGISYSNFSFNQ